MSISSVSLPGQTNLARAALYGAAAAVKGQIARGEDLALDGRAAACERAQDSGKLHRDERLREHIIRTASSRRARSRAEGWGSTIRMGDLRAPSRMSERRARVFALRL